MSEVFADTSFYLALLNPRDRHHGLAIESARRMPGRTVTARGLDHYRRRGNKTWSLTDCISFVVMQDRGLSEALTADHHFEQAGFRILMK